MKLPQSRNHIIPYVPIAAIQIQFLDSNPENWLYQGSVWRALLRGPAARTADVMVRAAYSSHRGAMAQVSCRNQTAVTPQRALRRGVEPLLKAPFRAS